MGGYELGFVLIMAFILIWSTVWKGLALWRAARNKSVPWFVILLIVNTAGLLEILYYGYFGNKKLKANKPKGARKRRK